ncbi:MAG TPA: hypothetical protein VG738_22320 [Chitinophagaceae bacterium]|nr:hypothetical protein [Chitinophagaceae bacterium]
MENAADNNWLWPALLTAAIAAAGYIAKLLIDTIKNLRSERRARRTHLLELYSLLKAGNTAFLVQKENRTRLMDSIRAHHAHIIAGKIGFEEIMEASFNSFSEKEKELHTIIRAITTHTILSLNTAMLEWLKKDDYYKAHKHDDNDLSKLSQSLMALEAHLYLWHAKYAIWMPDKPAHALVYLADEQKHGVEFPKGIDLIIEKVLSLNKKSTLTQTGN